MKRQLSLLSSSLCVSLHVSLRVLLVSLMSSVSAISQAQVELPALGSGPWIMDTFEQDYIQVSVLARNLDHPFGMVFVPDTATDEYPLGDILISERTGKVRLFRNGQLSDAIVADLTAEFPLEQLFDIELHPDYASNSLVYFTFIKTAARPDGTDGYWATTALGRGRFDGDKLVDLEEVIEAKAWSGNFGGASSRLHFLEDGTLLFGVSHRLDEEAPQSLDSHIGKILRLNDDGSVPADNPFVGVEGALPEIFALGIRSVMDMTTHPETGEIWELENGPQGGDEVNILRPGRNYGWPIATFGRDYDGTRFSPVPWVEGTEIPEVFWVPAITVAGLTFYTGDRFPQWKNNLFVTSMIVGRVPGTGHLERVVFNEFGEVRREQLLNSLQQRIRYVVQGPDELLYLLTDHSDGALLRIEPLSERVSDASGTGEQGLNATALFAGSDCETCHRADNPLVGPSYRDIATRYEPTDANFAQLAAKIIQGGAGVWGEVPMNPHPDLAPDDAREMAAQILGLQAQ